VLRRNLHFKNVNDIETFLKFIEVLTLYRYCTL